MVKKCEGNLGQGIVYKDRVIQYNYLDLLIINEYFLNCGQTHIVIFGVETLKNGTAMGNFTFEFRMTFPITETPFDDKRMKL